MRVTKYNTWPVTIVDDVNYRCAMQVNYSRRLAWLRNRDEVTLSPASKALLVYGALMCIALGLTYLYSLGDERTLPLLGILAIRFAGIYQRLILAAGSSVYVLAWGILTWAGLSIR
jgi:hypothetical protein